MKEKAATKEQVKPKGTGIEIIELVKQDLIERAEVGEKKYGEKLKPFNGRNALIDAYQEALDLCMYLRQLIYEEENQICAGIDFGSGDDKSVNITFVQKEKDQLVIKNIDMNVKE